MASISLVEEDESGAAEPEPDAEVPDLEPKHPGPPVLARIVDTRRHTVRLDVQQVLALLRQVHVHVPDGASVTLATDKDGAAIVNVSWVDDAVRELA